MVDRFTSALLIGDHAHDKPSNSNNKFHGRNNKVKFPCKFCEGNHLNKLCTLLDEASKELENIITSLPHFLASYQKLSPDPLLVDQVIDQKSSLFNPTLFESGPHESIINQPLVEKMVEIIYLHLTIPFQ